MPRQNNDKLTLYKLHPVPMEEVLNYQLHEIGETFAIDLKAPSQSEIFLDDHKHYTKSNINVCYAAPRSQGKARNWYETQLTVGKEVRLKSGYPIKGIPMYVVTDDGFGFMAHTTSQNNKQFAAIGDELILGRWIKNRLIEDGLIEYVDDISKDKERKGMITKEILEEYGCNAIAFQKTDMRVNDPDIAGNSYEVWTLKLVYLTDEE